MGPHQHGSCSRSGNSDENEKESGHDGWRLVARDQNATVR
jgi:hypothetical protein